MQIVELGDCSMIIMKDSEDSPWFSVGALYRYAVKRGGNFWVAQMEAPYDMQRATDYVYTAGRLVLFFSEKIRPTFYLHEKVNLDVI